MKRFSQLFFVLLVAVVVVFFVVDQPQTTQANEDNSVQLAPLRLEVQWPTIPSIGTSLNDLAEGKIELRELLVFVYTLLLYLSIMAGFVAIVYTGFLYIVSGANPTERKKSFDQIKRVGKGGAIILLAVLILSFLNDDLLKTSSNVNEALCAGVANQEACKKQLAQIAEQGIGYFDISGEEFKYAIPATGDRNIQKRLVKVARDNVQSELSQCQGVNQFTLQNAPLCANVNTGGDNGASTRFKKYDINRDGTFNEKDVRGFSSSSLLEILYRFCIDYYEDGPNKNRGENSYNCTWYELKRLINIDMTNQLKKWVDRNPNIDITSYSNVKPLYVVRQDDDIAPSCAARCIYAPEYSPNNGQCPGDVTEVTNGTKKCKWGFGSADEQRERDKLNLIKRDSDGKSGVNICKIRSGIDDEDFKKDADGYERAQCAARYVIDSFDVPLVGIYNLKVRDESVKVRVDGILWAEEIQLTACYCTPQDPDVLESS